MLEAGKMCKRKDLSEFDKGQFMMARRLGQHISNVDGRVRVCHLPGEHKAPVCTMGRS